MDWLGEVLRELALVLSENREEILRLILAAALGGVIGLEREASGKPAGFRTNLLICLGAALVTQLSIQIATDTSLPGGFRSDPGRIAAQVVSGIGFLGAGTILHARGSVTGLTTAATLWVVATIGMAVGAAAYVQALLATGLVMLALMILGRFEDHLLPPRPATRTLMVVVDARPELVAGVTSSVTAAGYVITGTEVDREEESFIVSFTLLGHAQPPDAIVGHLLGRPGVRKVTIV